MPYHSLNFCYSFGLYSPLDRYDIIKNHENVRGWLFTTLKNNLKELYRASLKADFVDIDTVIDLLKEPGFESNFELMEICKTILSEEAYNMIIDYYYKDNTLDEIAEKNNTSKGSIKMKLQRAYEKLRKGFSKINFYCALLLTIFLTYIR